MEKELEQRIKDMKQSAEKVQRLKQEKEQMIKKEAPQPSLAWNSRVTCELPYYLL